MGKHRKHLDDHDVKTNARKLENKRTKKTENISNIRILKSKGWVEAVL